MMKHVHRVTGRIARNVAALIASAALVACEATPAPVAPVAQDNNATATPAASPAIANGPDGEPPVPKSTPKPAHAASAKWCAPSRMPSPPGSPPNEQCSATRALCEQSRMMVRVPLGECEPRGGE